MGRLLHQEAFGLDYVASARPACVDLRCGTKFSSSLGTNVELALFLTPCFIWVFCILD